MLFRNIVCEVLYHDNVLGHANVFTTRDPAILQEYGTAMNLLVKDQVPLVARLGFPGPGVYRLCVSLFTQPGVRSVHSALPAFAMPPRVRDKLLSQCKNKTELAQLNTLCDKSLPGLNVVLCRAAVLDFAVYGTASLFGATVTVPEGMRADAMVGLIETVRNKGGEIRILEDENGLLARKDFDADLFLGKTALLGIRRANGTRQNGSWLAGTDVELMRGFGRFFDEIGRLPRNELMTAEESERFMRECVKLFGPQE